MEAPPTSPTVVEQRTRGTSRYRCQTASSSEPPPSIRRRPHAGSPNSGAPSSVRFLSDRILPSVPSTGDTPSPVAPLPLARRPKAEHMLGRGKARAGSARSARRHATLLVIPSTPPHGDLPNTRARAEQAGGSRIDRISRQEPSPIRVAGSGVFRIPSSTSANPVAHCSNRGQVVVIDTAPPDAGLRCASDGRDRRAPPDDQRTLNEVTSRVVLTSALGACPLRLRRTMVIVRAHPKTCSDPLRAAVSATRRRVSRAKATWQAHSARSVARCEGVVLPGCGRERVVSALRSSRGTQASPPLLRGAAARRASEGTGGDATPLTGGALPLERRLGLRRTPMQQCRWRRTLETCTCSDDECSGVEALRHGDRRGSCSRSLSGAQRQARRSSPSASSKANGVCRG